MGKHHIAKSGKRKGEWVACSAETHCRNGGTHIMKDDLIQVRAFQLKTTGKLVALSTLDMKSVATYQMLSSDEKAEVAAFEEERAQKEKDSYDAYYKQQNRHKPAVLNAFTSGSGKVSPVSRDTVDTSTYDASEGPLRFQAAGLKDLKDAMDEVGLTYDFVGLAKHEGEGSGSSFYTVDAVKVHNKSDDKAREAFQGLLDKKRVSRSRVMVDYLEPRTYEGLVSSVEKLNVQMVQEPVKVYGWTGSLKRVDFKEPVIFEGAGENVKSIVSWLTIMVENSR